MTIAKLRRVIMRLKERQSPDVRTISAREMRRAIFVECGTSPQTYYNNLEALKKLGWVRRFHSGFRIEPAFDTDDLGNF